MTDTTLPEQERPSRVWLVKTIGLSVAVALAVVTLGVLAIVGLESPEARSASAAAKAAPAGSDSNQAVQMSAVVSATIAPTVSPEPTATSRPLVSVGNTSTPTPTPVPTETSTPTPTPSPTTAARRVAQQTSSTAPQTQRTTATPMEPLHFTFYVKPYCHKSGESLMVVDIFVTGHGGHPPYNYYHDTELFAGQVNGMARLTLKAPSGNPVPLKIIVVDSAGQRYMEEFFYKTKLRCK